MSSAKELTALVWQHAPSKYNRSTLVVLLKLAGLTCADGHAYPSVPYLAASCGVSERAVQFCLQQLRKDGVLKIITRRGRSSHFFLQADALKKLPLAIPTEEADAQEPAATAEPVIDGDWLARALHHSISKQIPAATIPDDWRVTWTAAMQSLLDAGHSPATIRATARFALDHEAFSTLLLASRGAPGFAEKFDVIKRQAEESVAQKAA
jgi:biotin operon repressor